MLNVTFFNLFYSNDRFKNSFIYIIYRFEILLKINYFIPFLLLSLLIIIFYLSFIISVVDLS